MIIKGNLYCHENYHIATSTENFDPNLPFYQFDDDLYIEGEIIYYTNDYYESNPGSSRVYIYNDKFEFETTANVLVTGKIYENFNLNCLDNDSEKNIVDVEEISNWNTNQETIPI